MVFPNKIRELRLRRKGFGRIAGLDEAGRGAWAGPLVAAAVILDPKRKIRGIRDSKSLRGPDRQVVYERIISSALSWAVGVVEPGEVDRLGLQPANILAMERAAARLRVPADYLLVDGFELGEGAIPHRAVVDGDRKITSIAAASIVAKVTRDELMDRLDEQYPAYGFRQHKGYGTNHHHHMLMAHGVSAVHRKSFEPVKFLLELK